MLKKNNWWKRQPYWLKGGIIGIIINIIIGHFAISGFGLIISPSFGNAIMWPYFVLPNIIMDFLIKCSGYGCIENMYLAYFMWAPLSGFLIGALIGLIIQKVKKK